MVRVQAGLVISSQVTAGQRSARLPQTNNASIVPLHLCNMHASFPAAAITATSSPSHLAASPHCCPRLFIGDCVFRRADPHDADPLLAGCAFHAGTTPPSWGVQGGSTPAAHNRGVALAAGVAVASAHMLSAQLASAWVYRRLRSAGRQRDMPHNPTDMGPHPPHETWAAVSVWQLQRRPGWPGLLCWLGGAVLCGAYSHA